MADIIRNHKMRSFGVICVGPKYKDKCPFKDREGRHREKRRGQVHMEAEMVVI